MFFQFLYYWQFKKTQLKHKLVVEAEMNSLAIKHIRGFLDWESRLNLNMVLPSANRVGNRICKETIQAHEKYVIIELFKNKMVDFEELNKIKKIRVISEVFVRLMQPRYKVLYLYNDSLRLTVFLRAGVFKNAKLNMSRDELQANDAKELAQKARCLQKLINADMKIKALQSGCAFFNKIKAAPILLI